MADKIKVKEELASISDRLDSLSDKLDLILTLVTPDDDSSDDDDDGAPIPGPQLAGDSSDDE